MIMAIEEQANILIVDDKPDNLRLLSSILSDAGYKVRKVLDGHHALDAAQLAPPDLILLDIMMPKMDGYEVCQTLKTNPKTQNIPVIFLTALDEIEDKVRAFSLGAVDYIAKPFQKEEVIARVATHIKLQKLAKDISQSNLVLKAENEQRKKAEESLKKALQDLKTAQTQIILSEKLASLGILTSGIAHELRNPLNFVNNYAEDSKELVHELSVELQDQSVSPNKTVNESVQELLIALEDNVAAIYKHGRRAEYIINSMMQHVTNEIDSDQLVDISSLLDEARELVYHNRKKESNIVVKTIYDTTLGKAEVFPGELSRAIINILDNAFYSVSQKEKMAPEAFVPTILIKTCRGEGNFQIRIRDNGMGIQPEHRSKIFDPFFTTKPTGEGTGLGLSMTHEIIVRRHRGTLVVETEVESYTEFILTLPLEIQPNFSMVE